jgi:type II secretory pathway component PulL
MTHEMCGESIKEAKEFFAKYFPEYNYKALATTSWILDSQFEKLLKPSSNLVLFLKELYLLPTVNANDTQMLDRVFNAKRNEAGELNLSSLPQKSSMQKAIVAHMEKGLFCRNQSCVFFIEDLDWGNNVYRKMYDKIAK